MLYLLVRTDEVCYDEYDSFIVRAINKKEALNFVERETGNWEVKEELSGHGESEIILGSFNAG